MVKLNSTILSLAALAVFAPSSINAASTPTCNEQSKCIQWTVTKLDTDSCGVGGDCPVEVCMLVKGDLGEGDDKCGKGGGSATFSHMCSQTDSSGCPQWMDVAKTIPKLGDGSSTTCSESGQGSGVAAFGGKCSNSNNVLMCQEGKPGQTLYWILKDGEDSVQESKSYSMTYDSNTGCEAAVQCSNYEYKCGSTGSDVQKKKERTWAFTIPDGTNGSCNVCTGAVSPADPAQPESPADPAQPESPADPAQPESPADPAQPESPADPAQPATPAGAGPTTISYEHESNSKRCKNFIWEGAVSPGNLEEGCFARCVSLQECTGFSLSSSTCRLCNEKFETEGKSGHTLFKIKDRDDDPPFTGVHAKVKCSDDWLISESTVATQQECFSACEADSDCMTFSVSDRAFK